VIGRRVTARRPAGRRALVLALLAAGLAAAVLLAVGAGAVRVPPSSLLRLAAWHLGFRGVGLPPQQEVTILLLIRLPRVLAALLVGAGLAAGLSVEPVPGPVLQVQVVPVPRVASPPLWLLVSVLPWLCIQYSLLQY